MKVRAQVQAVLSVLLLSSVAAVAQQPTVEQGVASQLQDIVARLKQAQTENRERYRAYTVTREYKLFNDKQVEASSRVIADVSFVPPGTKEYAIRNTAGSRQGEKVVRKVLEHEQEVAGDWERTALIPENYDFDYVGEVEAEGNHCYVLQLKPKRESKDLVRGMAWVDSTTYNVHRMTGSPAKNPSWWVKNVELTLTFGEVDGMWLQTGAKADADVRLFGKHVLTARDMDYRVSAVTAAKEAPVKTRPRNYSTGAIGAGMILTH